MKTPLVLGAAGLLALIGLGVVRLSGEDGPSFARIRKLTNGEIALTLSVTNGPLSLSLFFRWVLTRNQVPPIIHSAIKSCFMGGLTHHCPRLFDPRL